MELRFRKDGIVTVGTAEPSQSINLNNPIGTVRGFNIDLIGEKLVMIIEATDGLNQVSRDFKIDLPKQAFVDLVMHFFAPHIQPAARQQYDEFKDLIQL